MTHEEWNALQPGVYLVRYLEPRDDRPRILNEMVIKRHLEESHINVYPHGKLYAITDFSRIKSALAICDQYGNTFDKTVLIPDQESELTDREKVLLYRLQKASDCLAEYIRENSQRREILNFQESEVHACREHDKTMEKFHWLAKRAKDIIEGQEEVRPHSYLQYC